MTEKEGKQQCTDVRTVHVRIRHDDDFVIPQLKRAEVVLADAGSDRGDHVPDLLVAEHLVITRFFDVENLPAEGKDRLIPAIAATLGRSACGLALNKVKFATL